MDKLHCAADLAQSIRIVSFESLFLPLQKASCPQYAQKRLEKCGRHEICPHNPPVTTQIINIQILTTGF